MARVHEPVIVKRNLFRSLPSGWTLRCCHQPENLWSNLEAARHVFSLRLLESRAGFPLLHDLAIFIFFFWSTKQCSSFLHRSAGWDRNKGTLHRALGWACSPMLQPGWQVMHWNTEFGAGVPQTWVPFRCFRWLFYNFLCTFSLALNFQEQCRIIWL